MVAFGGSQCGFCTPGFVMSMYSALQSNPNIKSKDMVHCMDGNLCRCTGYRPIIEAAKSVNPILWLIFLVVQRLQRFRQAPN
jgi:xanthine dehydrogenase iron-sulfur cluster and FAD-binding subunit A